MGEHPLHLRNALGSGNPLLRSGYPHTAWRPLLAGPQIKKWPAYHNSRVVHEADQIPVADPGADLEGSLLRGVGVRNVHQERHEAVTELALQPIGFSLFAYRHAYAIR
jgi:hypothetical protein